MELSVIVPCLNEEPNLPELIARVGEVFRVGELMQAGGAELVLNAAFQMQLKDNKSGFLICSREVLADLLTHRGGYSYWQSFIMVAAHHKGYTYKQIETLFENRRAGTSFLANHPVLPVVRSFLD